MKAWEIVKRVEEGLTEEVVSVTIGVKSGELRWDLFGGNRDEPNSETKQEELNKPTELVA